MKILVACEESQRVAIEFSVLGHEVYSCDLEFCSGNRPDLHIWSDVIPLLNGQCNFRTCDGQSHFVDKWDLIIAFPPCTYLSRAGACNLYKKGELDVERFERGQAAAHFFYAIWNANCDHIAVENPVPIKMFGLPAPTQIIQPYYFGEPVSKMTYLWLKNLPFVCPTNVVSPIYTFTSYPLFKNSFGKYRQKNRSKTFLGIAKAMALSWSNVVGLRCQKSKPNDIIK